MDSLYPFSAGSANDDRNKQLWVKGASLFIKQINELVEKTTPYSFDIQPIKTFQCDCGELGSILAQHNSDKSTSHNYHILYAHIFHQLGRNNALNVLEIGMGTNNPTLVSTMGESGRPGASLYAFRDYLPNSAIYGADIDRDILFTSDRIQTGYVDQLDANAFLNLATQFGDIKYDLIIDDGLHSIGANFNTLLFALDHLNDNGWIVIEDIHIIDNWKSIDFILGTNPKYNTYLVNALRGYLYVIQKV